MKKIFNYIIIGSLSLGVVSCKKDFVDLKPKDAFLDAVYFKQPGEFKAYATNFYSKLPGWDFGTMDNNSDLSANANGTGYDIGHGTIATSTSANWDYSGIRSSNILLSKAAAYTGTGDISQYVAEAYFFRAFAYFNLLKTYGGVPIITEVLDVNSPELYAPRNSRYEVVQQILADLDQAIPKLPTEQTIPSTDKGRISKWAAEAFKAQVELYEATWEKYVGQDPDGDGTAIGAGKAGHDAANVNKYLADAIAMSQDVMNNGGYAVWNKNSVASMANSSSWYLFNLEDAGSNPGGFDKSTNNEFILYTVYDYTLKKPGKNISWTSWQLYPSRKFVDMPVCKDGLPIDKSPLFQGYHKTGDEFKNRDLRLTNYLYASATGPTSATLDYGGLGSSGYGNAKYAVYGYGTRRTDNTESANYPIIRLAEVYLNYAEALIELNGSITDAELDASINKLRDRAGVARLTNALVTANGLDMKEEIRRERGVELYREGKRFDDLKRWGILEASLNPSRLGMVVGGADYPTDFKTASSTGADSVIVAKYKASSYVFGEEEVQTPAGTLKCVVVDSKQNHTIAKKHYLYPIPLTQISLNSKLLQNPGY
ncbi:RagB/SusD family nutrient uptake outer membrane protein [Terrimonas pollutisoli]|uniref:RagB/SusD family nutrient uptake outer membrane protein n=1 Tax=Terrimonas pollutisoli TaxID=3034147 RepID=UPI0023ECB80B|nr:RagB/SusD family nutrient uptake outer membrane protein [Terrimonas sp. H1YJ31]